MKTRLTFKLRTENAVIGRRFVLIYFAVFWIMLMCYRSSAHETFAATVKFWIGGVCLFLIFMGQWQARMIINGARVLRQQRAPQHLWQAWLRASLTDTTRIWGILVVAGIALLLLLAPKSPWTWSSAAALFSATLSLSTVAAMSNAGVLRRAWAWVITVGGMLLVLLAAITIGLSDSLNQLAQAPFIVHGLMAISWPLLAYFFLKKWQHNPPIPAVVPGEKSIDVGTRISNYARRFTPIGARGTPARIEKLQTAPAISLVGSVWMGLVLPLSTLWWFAVPWHGDIRPLHFLGLGVLPVYVSTCLLCKDLHWRQLLAPGGLHHGRLGWPIFKTTVALQLAGALLLLIVWMAVRWAAFDVSVARSLELAWDYRILPVEFAFAASLMSVLRAACAGSIRTTFVLMTAYLAILATLGSAHLWVFGNSKGPILFSVDSIFLCGLLLATAAFVLLSNRLWTVKKLQPFLRLN